MKKRITAIIPAFNEEKYIKGVLAPLVNSSYINEIICVDDGSTDSTLEILKGVAGIEILHYKINRGKSYAVARGIEKATGDIVLFFDADLHGLTDKHIGKLISPLFSGKYDVSIGYRSSRMESSIGVPFSGERAYFRKDVLPHIKKFENKGFGLELYLNFHFKNKRKKIFKMDGLLTYAKSNKVSKVKAIRYIGEESFEVISEIVKRKNVASYFLNAYLVYVYINDKSLSKYFSYKSFIEYFHKNNPF